MENKSNSNVVITVYEEAPRPRRSVGRPQTDRQKLRAPARGYDRRVMLLAYSHQLRQSNAQMEELPPQWKSWKANYLDQNYGSCFEKRKNKRKKGFRWNIRSCIRRVFRRRRWCYHRIDTQDREKTMEMSSISYPKHWRLRRLVNRIACAWRRRGGLMGCYEKLNNCK